MPQEIIKFPWNIPAATPSTDDTIKMLQRDFSIAVQLTGVLVYSEHAALKMLVNTKRGQIIPRGECKLSDGTTIEFQDIGMPQPNSPYMTVPELVAKLWDAVRELGLELI